MTFHEYQAAAKETAQYPVIGNSIIYPTLGLVGEAGEVADKIKKIFRDKNGDIENEKDALIKELGDCLWYLAAMAEELDTSLDYIATVNIDKLRSRKDRGTLGGEGDNR